MGRYFTEEQLDKFMAAYLAKYPDAMRRWNHMLDHQEDDPGEITAINKMEVLDVAKAMSFFQPYAERLQREILDAAGGEFSADKSFMHRNVRYHINENHLKYFEYLRSRTVDQFGFHQAGFDLYQDVGARIRNAYAKKHENG